jgi:hypothetical protein
MGLSWKEKQAKNLSVEYIAAFLLSNANYLNGNENPPSFTNKADDEENITILLKEINQRISRDSSLNDHPYLKPILAAIKGNDTGDAQVIAIALKDVQLPEAVEKIMSAPGRVLADAPQRKTRLSL